MTGPEHYKAAERLIDSADLVLDADYGWMGSMTTEERLARRGSDLTAAQVHATLALAAATALNVPAGETGGMYLADTEAWEAVASALGREGGEAT